MKEQVKQVSIDDKMKLWRKDMFSPKNAAAAINKQEVLLDN